MRHKKVQKRVTDQDLIYKNRLVEKFINSIMQDGKKTVAQKIVYGVFDKIKAEGKDPIETFDKAIQNVGPKVEVRPRRVGGASYQVPVEVRADRRTSLAMRWIIESARARSNKDFHTFAEKLLAEITDANQNLGGAIKKRDNILRMAEANRAFAHFRW